MILAFLWLCITITAFVATHLLMSHPLRAGLVDTLGASGFMAFYSLVALVTLTLAVLAFGAAPRGPIPWDGHSWPTWFAASLLTYLAMALFIASLIRNPALPGAKVNGLSAKLPRGVYRVTRHPMMFGIAIWAFAHLLVAPSPRSIVLMGGFIVLALVGAHWQDEKKITQHGRDWRAWVNRTPFWPDLRQIGQIGWPLGVAIVPWLIVTWLHVPLADEPAGVWVLFSVS